MATAANILLITACIFLVIAALSTYTLTQRHRNNSSGVLELRTRALITGIAALALALLGGTINNGDTELWFGAAVIMVISLATIARAGTYQMSHR